MLGTALAQGLDVAATTTVIADLVRKVGYSRVRAATVLPVGADPHRFEPRPSTVQALSGSRLLFVNGMNLEVFLDHIAWQLPRGAQVVRLADFAARVKAANNEIKTCLASTHGKTC